MALSNADIAARVTARAAVEKSAAGPAERCGSEGRHGQRGRKRRRTPRDDGRVARERHGQDGRGSEGLPREDGLGSRAMPRRKAAAEADGCRGNSRGSEPPPRSRGLTARQAPEKLPRRRTLTAGETAARSKRLQQSRGHTAANAKDTTGTTAAEAENRPRTGLRSATRGRWASPERVNPPLRSGPHAAVGTRENASYRWRCTHRPSPPRSHPPRAGPPTTAPPSRRCPDCRKWGR